MDKGIRGNPHAFVHLLIVSLPDFTESDAPWRVPHSDPTDWFNYGFDEYTWSAYRLKQNSLRETNQNDRLDSLIPNGVPPISGMPGMPMPLGGPQAPIGMQQMQGFVDISAEDKATLEQIMVRGGDISQMDPAAFLQLMQQRGGAQGNGASAANQTPGFMVGGNGYGQQNQPQQQMGFGFDASAMAGGDGRNRAGNFGARGRGGNRRNW